MVSDCVPSVTVKLVSVNIFPYSYNNIFITCLDHSDISKSESDIAAILSSKLTSNSA